MDSQIVNVIIGLVFFYLMLSLVCSVLGEMFAGMLAWRAGTLYKGLRDFFFDRTKEGLVDSLYEDPSVAGLKRSYWWHKVGRWLLCGAGRPKEIPTQTFIDALENTANNHPPPPDSETAAMVNSLSAKSKEEKGIWWQERTGNLTSRYRAKMQWLIVVTAIGVTTASNADSIMWFNSLWSDATLRAGIFVTMGKLQESPNPESAAELMSILQNEVHKLQIFGWTTTAGNRRSFPQTEAEWVFKIVGLLITVVVVSRTAPYAFDFFRIIINYFHYRSTR